MGVLYYNSPEEQKKLKTEIHDKKLEMFHTDHVNEKGEPTDGKSGRLIFGTSEQRKNTINVKFTKISGVFDEKLERIVRLNKVFPEMYDSHKKEKVRRLREVIGIDEETQKKLVQELKKMGRIKEDFDDLQELRMIYFQFFQPPYTDKKIEELVKKFRIKSMADRIVVDDIFDEMYLRREPIFVREMSLVYLVTSFKEYVKNISELIFKLNPHLFKSAKTSFSKKSQKTQLEEKMVFEEL